MLVDSHCHLDFPELAGRIDQILESMAAAGVGHALCACVSMERFPGMISLVAGHPGLFAAVGVHPDTRDQVEPDTARLVELARHPKVVAIGETGLDYFRQEGDLEWQRAPCTPFCRPGPARLEPPPLLPPPPPPPLRPGAPPSRAAPAVF